LLHNKDNRRLKSASELLYLFLLQQENHRAAAIVAADYVGSALEECRLRLGHAGGLVLDGLPADLATKAFRLFAFVCVVNLAGLKIGAQTVIRVGDVLLLQFLIQSAF